MKESTKKISSKLRRIASIAMIAVIAVMLAAVVYVFVCNIRGKVANIGGYSIMKVITGSMEPSIHVDDYILVKKIDPDDLEVGDVITFLSDDPEIKDMPNSHRITSINDDGTFTVKGDANPSEDVYKVRRDRIVGKYVKKLWLFRFIGSFASTKKLLMICFILPTVCICIYEAHSLFRIIRGTDGDEDDDDDDSDTDSKTETTEQKKERLIREAIEKEKERLRQADKLLESEVAQVESGKDNEAQND